MAALLPIEPIIDAAKEDEFLIELCIGIGNPISINTALFIADQTINTLIRNITRKIFTPEEKRVIAEHLTALGIVSIERTGDILYALICAPEIDTGILMEKLCKMHRLFDASENDEAGWVRYLENEFPFEEDADADR